MGGNEVGVCVCVGAGRGGGLHFFTSFPGADMHNKLQHYKQKGLPCRNSLFSFDISLVFFLSVFLSVCSVF